MDGQVHGEEYGKRSLLKMRKGWTKATYVLNSDNKNFNWIFRVFLQVMTNRNSSPWRTAGSPARGKGSRNASTPSDHGILHLTRASASRHLQAQRGHWEPPDFSTQNLETEGKKGAGEKKAT